MPEQGPANDTTYCELCGTVVDVELTLLLPCCRKTACLECEADGWCGCGDEQPEPPTAPEPLLCPNPRCQTWGCAKHDQSPAGAPPANAPVQGARCSGCDAPVVWITTPAGRSMICDPALVPFWPGKGPDRLVSAVDGSTIAGSARQVDLFSPAPVYGYVPHWGNCPKADDFRGSR